TRLYAWWTLNRKAPRRFHIHLSIAVIMMFTAGGILGANLAHREPDANNLDYPAKYGWPFSGILAHHIELRSAGGYVSKVKIVYLPSRHVEYAVLFINVAVALLILATVWFLSEWLIRRLAPRK